MDTPPGDNSFFIGAAIFAMMLAVLMLIGTAERAMGINTNMSYHITYGPDNSGE